MAGARALGARAPAVARKREPERIPGHAAAGARHRGGRRLRRGGHPLRAGPARLDRLRAARARADRRRLDAAGRRLHPDLCAQRRRVAPDQQDDRDLSGAGGRYRPGGRLAPLRADAHRPPARAARRVSQLHERRRGDRRGRSPAVASSI